MLSAVFRGLTSHHNVPEFQRYRDSCEYCAKPDGSEQHKGAILREYPIQRKYPSNAVCRNKHDFPLHVSKTTFALKAVTASRDRTASDVALLRLRAARRQGRAADANHAN